MGVSAKTDIAVSGVSWAAVLAGAFVTAEMILALMTVGTGPAISP